MIRVIVERTFVQGKKYIEASGSSGDTKPTENIIGGSKFTETDTGKTFLFDEDMGAWVGNNSGNGKTLISNATVTLGAAVAYDGTEKTKAVSSVVVGTDTLTENTDYIVTGNKATEVGTYTMRIVGIGEYTGYVDKEWEITTGTGSVTASPDSRSRTAGGDDGTSALTVVGDGAVSVSSSAKAVATATVSGTTVTVTPVAEGSATITVTLAGSEHYTGGTDTIAVTVAEADGGDS